MKKSAVLAALFVLAVTACGSQTDPASSSPPSSAAAPVDAERAEWCESFKRMENPTQSVSVSQALADSTDPALSSVEREDGMRRYLELTATPPNSQTDAQCSGAVWDRFYAETKATSSAGATGVN
ncbi:hypothetical protein [Rhodococcus sp. SORGH_AS_0301]|uniref:hypothetical protein n=1 Tax=Rhodococcus sp. SORGH_AS_0301 TaxID=3041780 RepID=UPI00278A635F|nr:hypothetical protein [Rhodococcus sp. SORGH_AS_0301]MDQ1182035.1 hypothetical protein [Rhodococcus sp. SORGH_AS_0301]